VLNKVPRHEDMSCAQLNITTWRRMGEWLYSSTCS